MNKSKLLGILLGWAACVYGTNSHAQIAVYDLVDASGTELPLSSSTAPFTFSSMTAVGLSSVAFSNHFYFSDWEASVNPGKYLTLTVNNPQGYTLNNMTFSVESSGSAEATISVRSSQDSFTADIDAFTWGPTGDVTNGSFDLSSVGQVSGPLELRFYVVTTDNGSSFGFANHEAGGAGAGSDDIGRDIEIFGTMEVVAVPVMPIQLLLLSILVIGAIGSVAQYWRRHA